MLLHTYVYVRAFTSKSEGALKELKMILQLPSEEQSVLV